MLQAIRSKASSFIVKVLFGLLIVTFGIWGIADIFTNRSPDTTVATVGNRIITLDQVNSALQTEMQRLETMLGRPIDAAQAKRLGVVDDTLQRLIDSDLADLEADRLDLKIGDAAVRRAIIDNPNFRNQAGVFDRQLFDSILAQNNMSEAQFEEEYRGDLLRGQLAQAISDGWTAPAVLTDTLFASRFERRSADIVTLPASAAGAVPTPSAAQLAAFYKSHLERYRAPELRSFKLAVLSPEQIALGITVPEARLAQAYKARQGEFLVPEQRHLLQMLLPSEAKAKAAEAALASGKTFDAVGKQIAGADAKALDLGWVKRSDLPTALADAAFALKAGGTSAPIHTEFGWHIVRVEAIKPETSQSFDTVKPRLAKEVALDMAGDQAADMANKIDDALAGGATFEEVAKKFALKTSTIAGTDAQGKDINGKPVDLPRPAAEILKVAFATARGQTSELSQLGSDSYFIVKVDTITPSAPRPLADIHAEVVSQWQADERRAALAKQANAIVSAVKAGQSLKQVAAARKLAVTAVKPMLRNADDANMPPSLVAMLFDIKPGSVVAAPSGDAYVVAELTGVTPAQPKTDPVDLHAMSRQLDAAMRNDLLSEYSQVLRREYEVDINQTNLDRVM